MPGSNLNFVEAPTPRLRMLQAGTLLAVLGSVALSSSLLFGVGRGGTATIADTFASASFSALPVASNTPKPKAISENKVVSAAMGTTSDTVRYYEQDTGKIFSVSLSSLRTAVISEKRLSGFLFAFWVPYADSAVSGYQKPAGIEFRFDDFKTGDSATIGSNLSAIAVSPTGRNLALLQRNPDDSYSVLTSDIDGSDAVKLLTTRVEEPRLFWANATNLALLSRRADRPGYDLTLVSPDGTLRTLLTNKENLDVLWSPDGKYLLYSYFSSEAGTTLWLRSLEAGDEVNLGIYTSALKCAWHPVGLAVTCGIPVQKSLNGDVPADQSASIDDVLTYDFEANTLRSVYNGVRSSLVGVTKPLVSSSGKYFVFTNMFDSRLYMLPLQ